MFTIFLLIAGIELLVQGPTLVGMPVLANTRLAEGALALGVIIAAFSGGSLLGTVLGGVIPTPKRHLGPLLIALLVLAGLLLMPFGSDTTTATASALLFWIGISSGFSYVLFTSWLQARTPAAMEGRVMSLLMAASIGLAPISNAVAGGLIKLSLSGVFLVAGAAMALLSLLVGIRREVRDMRISD